MGVAKFEITRKCKICGEPFVAKTITSWYCSPRCSKVAFKRRKDEEKRNERLDAIAKATPKDQEYITVPEAYSMFGISKETLYRLIRKGVIPSVNVGQRQTRVSKETLMEMYPLRKSLLKKQPKPIPKLYSLEPKDCYTIQQACEKYRVTCKSVWIADMISKLIESSISEIAKTEEGIVVLRKNGDIAMLPKIYDYTDEDRSLIYCVATALVDLDVVTTEDINTLHDSGRPSKSAGILRSVFQLPDLVEVREPWWGHSMYFCDPIFIKTRDIVERILRKVDINYYDSIDNDFTANNLYEEVCENI